MSYSDSITKPLSSNDQTSPSTSESGFAATIAKFIGRVFSTERNCDNSEAENAIKTQKLHNAVERVAYRALADKIIELDIKNDHISEEQSGVLLSHIKKQAHIEMYKDKGYIKERSKYLNPSQLTELMKNLGTIIHDRDTKLTDARYGTLTELLMGLDDHNTMVKEILLKSWYKCPNFSDPRQEHLAKIKAKVAFYEDLSKQLSFNLADSLEKCKLFWDNYFPGIRVADEGRSKAFVNITEVRALLKDRISLLKNADSTEPLIFLLTEEERKALFYSRSVYNYTRNKTFEAPALLQKDTTVGELRSNYFPEYNLEMDQF